MWVRASFFALLGVAAALLAVKVDPLVPDELPTKIGADAVHQILNILATSMLSVTTFSLSVMVSSYSASTNNVSPRATRLLREDPTTQNVLAVFLGSFLFSLVGIVALNTGYYSDRGRFVLFLFSIGVIGIIVFTMLRWIDHLTRLGRVGETTARVEKATADAVRVRLETPFLGGSELTDEKQKEMDGGYRLYPEKIGYVAYIDMASVQSAADELKLDICLCAMPGSFVHSEQPLVIVGTADDYAGVEEKVTDNNNGSGNNDCLTSIRQALEIVDERSYSQDPRFGFDVLAEVASRALSPAVNDAGTAIDVIGRGVRLLAPWVSKRNEGGDKEKAVQCPRVFVPEISANDLFDDFFSPIARDGAQIFEVQIRLQKGLLALAEMGDQAAKSAAVRHSQEALERAEISMTLESEKQPLRDIVARINKVAGD